MTDRSMGAELVAGGVAPCGDRLVRSRETGLVGLQSINRCLGNFKISGGKLHWNLQLPFWRNFRECDFGTVCVAASPIYAQS